MERQPLLITSRLTLRPFLLADAARVQQLAGDSRVSRMTVNIPHPYKNGMAEAWISSHAKSFACSERVVYAVTISATRELIGTVSLTQITKTDCNLGYWIGIPYWDKGYCTEAVGALISFGFNQYELPLIYARHLAENQASGRVLLKNEFKHAGRISMEINGETRFLEHYEKTVEH